MKARIYPFDYEADIFTKKSAAYINSRASADEARNFLSNTTFYSTDFFHGAQIEYLAANGKSYLWYLGNLRPTQGEWKTEVGGLFGVEVCFRYGPNSYNPVTGSRGSFWHCDGYDDWNAILKGDPFKLASGRVPFIMPKRSAFKYLFDIRIQAGLPGPFINLICEKKGPC